MSRESIEVVEAELAQVYKQLEASQATVERLRREVEDWKQTCTGLRRANANSQSEKRLLVEAKWVRNALQEIDEAYQLESPMIRPTKASVISHLNSLLSERDTLAARVAELEALVNENA